MSETSVSWGALSLGALVAACGVYGAYEAAQQMTGESFNYVIASSVVAATAAIFIPPMAERLWARGHYVKSIVTWLAVFPVAAFVVLASQERYHDAKAGKAAEIEAAAKAATRAQADLDAVKARLPKAEADEAEARARIKRGKSCGPQCSKAIATAEALRNDKAAAERILREAEAAAIKGAKYAPPPWLLPLSLDLAALALIWAGGTGGMPKMPVTTVTVQKPAAGQKTKKVVGRKRQRRKAPKVAKPPSREGDNVIPFVANDR